MNGRDSLRKSMYITDYTRQDRLSQSGLIGVRPLPATTSQVLVLVLRWWASVNGPF